MLDGCLPEALDHPFVLCRDHVRASLLREGASHIHLSFLINTLSQL